MNTAVDTNFLTDMIALANHGKWDQFDQHVLQICDDPQYLSWSTEQGLSDQNDYLRDLAISIFEQTALSTLSTHELTILTQRFERESNLHLKRKLAFVLCKYGNREKHVLDCIQDAKSNDPELWEKVQLLLRTI